MMAPHGQGVKSRDDAPSTVGSRVRDLLAARGWRQTEAAERAGISPQRLHDILTDRGSPTVATLEHLATAWGVAPRRLLP